MGLTILEPGRRGRGGSFRSLHHFGAMSSRPNGTDTAAFSSAASITHDSTSLGTKAANNTEEQRPGAGAPCTPAPTSVVAAVPPHISTADGLRCLAASSLHLSPTASCSLLFLAAKALPALAICSLPASSARRCPRCRLLCQCCLFGCAFAPGCGVLDAPPLQADIGCSKLARAGVGHAL